MLQGSNHLKSTLQCSQGSFQMLSKLRAVFLTLTEVTKNSQAKIKQEPWKFTCAWDMEIIVHHGVCASYEWTREYCILLKIQITARCSCAQYWEEALVSRRRRRGHGGGDGGGGGKWDSGEPSFTSKASGLVSYFCLKKQTFGLMCSTFSKWQNRTTWNQRVHSWLFAHYIVQRVPESAGRSRSVLSHKAGVLKSFVMCAPLAHGEEVG